LKVQLQLGDLRAEAEGTPDEVLRFVSGFISQHLPAYSLARRLVSSPGVEGVIEALHEFVGYSESEGLYLRPTVRVLSNPDRILLFLAMKRLENLLGRSAGGSVPVPQLSESLGLNMKSATARLAELTKHGLVRRVERGEYEITTAGLEELLSRLRTLSLER